MPTDQNMANPESSLEVPESQESQEPEPMLYYYVQLPEGMQLPTSPDGQPLGIAELYELLQETDPSSGPPGSCGRVKLYRDGKGLGLIFADPKPDQALLIIAREGDSGDSAVERWNLNHPCQQIQPGMAILSVNGLEDPHEMLPELKTAEEMEIYLKFQLTEPETLHFHESLQQHQIQRCLDLFQPVTITEELEPCSICHEDMDASIHQVVRLVPCMHHFHPNCVAHWILSNEVPRCPLCCTNLGWEFVLGTSAQTGECPSLVSEYSARTDFRPYSVGYSSRVLTFLNFLPWPQAG